MVSDPPAPLSPADCDLRGYDFMPLFGNRLFNSHLYRKAIRDPRAGLAAIKLWWVAWQQCPAGSLPDDDDDLAMLADFGLDTKAWAKVRDLALHGFVKCSDGRLYHPVLCTEAVKAFNGRRKERERKAALRAKKSGPAPDGFGCPEDVPRDKPRTGGGTETGQAQAVPADSTVTETERVVALKWDSGRQPCRSDPPDKWLHLADRREVHSDGTTHAIINGISVSTTAEMVCEAAGINEANWRGDWRPMIGWLQDGLDPWEQIIPAIRRVAQRPSYRLPASLAYFDKAVRESPPRLRPS